MPTTNFDGPLNVYGDMAYIQSPPFTNTPVPDPNTDAGPSLFYQWAGFPDVRQTMLKDKVTGYTGMIPACLPAPLAKTFGGIPAAFSATNIAPVAHVVTGTAMTLATRSFGVEVNIPIRPATINGALNGNAVVTAALALDYGFDYCTTTTAVSTAATITVLDSTKYVVGMPLVIARVGNSGGTVPLLTQVVGIPSATTVTINSANVPLAAVTGAAVGTGDLWGPSEIGFPIPMAAFPYVAQGPGLFLDDRQTLARGVSITSVASSSGGNFIVAGWDIYGYPMTETITSAGGAAVAYGKKAFKYIGSVTPQFTDAFNYSVGTSDVFGFAFKSGSWETTRVFWAGAAMTSSAGWTAGTAPASGDVRGTIQASAQGGGTGIGTTNSNGSISTLTVSGNRLELTEFLGVIPMLYTTPFNTLPLYGAVQT